MKPERLARTVICESPWVNHYVDRVRMPSGHIVEQHHLLDFPRPIVVAVVDDGAGALLFVRLWRYPTGAASWELVAGGVEAGESPVEAVAREVLEETGYRTAGHELVYTCYPLPGIANRLAHIFRCRALERVGEPDPGEVTEGRWFSRQEVRQMLRQRAITCGISLTALLLHLHEEQTAADEQI